MHVVTGPTGPGFSGGFPSRAPSLSRKPKFVPHTRKARSPLQRANWPIEAASLLFFDIETTSLHPDRGAQITEMAVVDRHGVRLDWRRAPEQPHDDALATQLPHLFDLLQTGVVVGHNLSFDVRFIAYVASRLGLRGPTIRYIDTLGLARRLLDRTRDVRLTTLLDYFGIVPDGALHTARVDALATQALFWKLVAHGGLETLADAGLQRIDWVA